MFPGIIGSPVAEREAIQRGRIVPCLPGFAGVRYPGDSSGLHSERSDPEAVCLSIAEEYLTDKQKACQEPNKLQKNVSLTSKKPVRDQINWIEVVDAFIR